MPKPKRHNKKKNKSGKCPNVEKKVEEISRMLEESTTKVQVSSVSIPKNQPGATTLTVETKLSKEMLTFDSSRAYLDRSCAGNQLRFRLIVSGQRFT